MLLQYQSGLSRFKALEVPGSEDGHNVVFSFLFFVLVKSGPVLISFWVYGSPFCAFLHQQYWLFHLLELGLRTGILRIINYIWQNK